MRDAKLCKKICPSYGNLSIFSNGVTNIECKNCQYLTLRRGNSIISNTRWGEIDQDVEFFFKGVYISKWCQGNNHNFDVILMSKWLY